MIYRIIFFMAMGVAYGTCQAQDFKWDPSVAGILDSLAQSDVPEGAPGVALGVVVDGKVVYEQYAGFANLKSEAPISGTSRFNIASNGKQFTALAVLLLAHEGKLALEDDIRQYFPELFPNIADTISIASLLHHTSGIRDYYSLHSLQGKVWWREKLDNQDVLDLIRQQEDLNFTPGSQHVYSNSNYILLAELVGKVSGQPFTEYTKSLFQQLGMPHTAFVSDYHDIAEPIARPYFNFKTWKGYDWTCSIHGDGNLFSTLPDQMRWEQVVQTGKAPGIPEAVLRQSQLLEADTSVTTYGYGLEFSTYRNLPYRYHEGGTGAWKAIMMRFPEQNMSLITLTNSGKVAPTYLANAAADGVLGFAKGSNDYPIAPSDPAPPATLEAVVGVYQTQSGYTYTLEQRDTSLFLLRNGRNDIRLVRESGHVFHQWNDPTFKQEFRAWSV
ncbi:MAG: serine hydrolase domain-containing protein [Bacteroidota bacterium]